MNTNMNDTEEDTSSNDISFDDMVNEIKRYVNELSIEERKEIYKMFVNVISDSKIQEKKTGIQVKIRDIPKQILVSIYKYIQHKRQTKLTAIQYFPNE